MGIIGPFDYEEPEWVKDVFVDGIARIEPLGDGLLVRVWLYTEQRLAETVRTVCGRLVLPIGRAITLNDEAGRAIRQIHRANNPLKVVG